METLTDILGLSVHDMGNYMEQKTIEQHRAEFEEWAIWYGYQEDDLRRSPFSFVSTKYFDVATEHHWQVWLAARGIKE